MGQVSRSLGQPISLALRGAASLLCCVVARNVSRARSVSRLRLASTGATLNSCVCGENFSNITYYACLRLYLYYIKVS